jgi:hypothetical protein
MEWKGKFSFGSKKKPELKSRDPFFYYYTDMKPCFLSGGVKDISAILMKRAGLVIAQRKLTILNPALPH